MNREPALIVGFVASLLILVAGKLGIVIDHASVEAVLTPIITAVITRFFVTPAAKAKRVPDVPKP